MVNRSKFAKFPQKRQQEILSVVLLNALGVYNSTRRYGLKLGETKEKALARSIEGLKKDYPTWRPSYDRDYFRLSDN